MNETLDNELRELEAQLANLTPNQMPDDMLYRMEQAMIGWEDHLPVSPDDEKIVPFNSTDHSSAPTSSKSNLHVFGAAAAIALMASLAAVFMTGNTQNASVLAGGFTSPSSAVPIENSMVNNTLPELSRNITHASNEGITFAGKNEAPFKVLRIEYTEKVITHDKDGKLVITNKPCVEHVLIPVPVH